MKNFFVRLSAQQRKTDFEPILDVSSSSIVLLTDGNSRYREGQVTARYQFHGQDQIVGSYTRSSAVGDLNDYNSFYGAIQNPIIRPNQRGPLPWDAPNRWLFWSNLSLPSQVTVFPALDVRTGFPYSVVDEDLNYVGARNQAGRYPTFVSLDAQVTKRFLFKNHHTTLGLKVFNITNHDNPRDFQNNLARQRLRSLLQQRGPHLPRQVHLRVLRLSHDHTTNRSGAEAANRVLGLCAPA